MPPAVSNLHFSDSYVEHYEKCTRKQETVKEARYATDINIIARTVEYQ